MRYAERTIVGLITLPKRRASTRRPAGAILLVRKTNGSRKPGPWYATLLLVIMFYHMDPGVGVFMSRQNVCCFRWSKSESP
ncbi:hypothetical protein BJX70DRAFT_376801 [Aspergillus crustosus]